MSDWSSGWGNSHHYYYKPDVEKLPGIARKAVEHLNAITSGKTVSERLARESCSFLFSDLEDEVGRHGMERITSGGYYSGYKEPNDGFYPCLISITNALRKAAEAKTFHQDGGYRAIAAIAATHETIQNLMVKPTEGKANQVKQGDTIYTNLLKTENLCTAAILELSHTEPPASAWSELESLKHRSGYVNHWDSVPVTVLKKWSAKMPYGKQGAVAFKRVLEMRSCLKGKVQKWETVLSELVSDAKDSRRCAEILLWIAQDSTKCNKYTPKTISPDSTTIGQILRKCADGVPPDMVWSFINDPNLALKASEEALAASQPGYELEGKWVYGGSSYTIERRDGALIWNEKVYSHLLEGEIKTSNTAGQPRLPPSFPARWSAGLNNGGAIFIRALGEHALESVYKDDAESLASGVKTIATRSADSGRDTVIGYCSKLLQTTLASPPTPEVVTNCQKAFQQLPQLASGLLKHLEDRFTLRHCHATTAVRVLQTLPGDANAIIGPNGFLKKQSNKKPSQNLIAVVLEVLESQWPLASQDAITIIKNVAMHEHHSSDPAAVLLCLSSVARTDFDGTWDWLRGYKEKDYFNAFEICGHHVRCTHPELASASVVDVDYFADSIEFRLIIRAGASDHVGGAGAPTANTAELAQDQNIGAGDRVRVRDHAASDWKLGIVTEAPDAANPNTEVKVRSDGWQTAYTWNFIEKVLAPPPSEAASHGTNGSWSTSVRVKLTRYPQVVAGSWKTSYGDDNECEFKPRVIPPPSRGYVAGDTGFETLAPALQEWVARWDPRGCGSRLYPCATDFVEQVVNGDVMERDRLLPRMWEWVVRKVMAHHFRFMADLDAWVFGGSDGLQTCKGSRKEAAQVLLEQYFLVRKIEWHTAPINLEKAKPIAGIYKGADVFFADASAAQTELQEKINSRNVSRSQVLEFERHRAILDANKIELTSNVILEDIGKELRGVEHTSAMLRELVDRWGVNGADDLLAQLEDTVRQRDLTPLCLIEQLHKEVCVKLGAVLQLPDAATSPLLRAHFLQKTGGKTHADDFPKKFNLVLKDIATMTISTPCVNAVADLDPPEGNYAEGRRDQEQRLLTSLGVQPDVIEALLYGALPLRLAVHGLGAFRRLAINPPSSGLKLHDCFFDDNQDSLLLHLNADKVKLSDCSETLKKLRDVSAGCRANVLRLIAAVLQCGALVDFVRRHPETQDTGLANVLANARDKQHADFQTFLEACTYINPFVAASALHAEMVDKQEQGDDEDSVLLRPKMMCSKFFASLSDAFAGGEEGANMNMLEEMLLTTSEKDKLEALEQLVASKTTTTDALVVQCNTLVDSMIEIVLPPTGTPTLVCKPQEAALMILGQYKDVIYRATLQRISDPSLDTFVTQSKEVLRAYLGACSLFDEGHLEFRGRTLSFKHSEANRVHTLLQSLRGQWVLSSLAKERGADSLLAGSIKVHPVLGALSSAELVRLALLLRSAKPLSASIGSAFLDALKPGRKLTIKKGEQVVRDEVLMTESVRQCIPVACALEMQAPEFVKEAQHKEKIMWGCKHETIELAEDDARATRKNVAFATAPMCVSPNTGRSGYHEWNIEILCGPTANSHIGVCSPSIDLSGGAECYEQRWTLTNEGTMWGANKKQGSRLGGYTTGDVITLHLDADACTLHFSVNGEKKTQGISNVKLPVSPCGCLSNPGMSIRITRPIDREAKNNISISGSNSLIDGVYTPALSAYYRHDGAVLCSAGNGWAVYESDKYKARRLLASVESHNGSILPHEMGDWREVDTDGNLKLQSSSDVEVGLGTTHEDEWIAPTLKEQEVKFDNGGAPIKLKPDDETPEPEASPAPAPAPAPDSAPAPASAEDLPTATSEELPWMSDLFTDEHRTNSELGVTFAVVKDAFVVQTVTNYLLGADFGLLPDMRILSVNHGPRQGRTGTPGQLLERLQSACESGSVFTTNTRSAAAWDYVSDDMQCSGTSVTKSEVQNSTLEKLKLFTPQKKETHSLAFSPTVVTEWKIKITGDVYGARVGAATADFDVSKNIGAQPNAKNAWWLHRNGRMYHGNTHIKNTGGQAFKRGDVISVRYGSGKLEFAVNDNWLPCSISNIPAMVHPVVYLPSKTASACLAVEKSKPKVRALFWTRKADGITFEDDNKTCFRSGASPCCAFGEQFQGGRKSFEFSISDTCASSLFGVLSATAPVDRMFPGGETWGVAIRPNVGELFFSGGEKVWGPNDSLKFGANDRIRITVDYEEQNFAIYKNGTKVVDAEDLDEEVSFEGPLAPCAMFGDSGIKCKLYSVMHPGQLASPAPQPEFKIGDVVTINADPENASALNSSQGWVEEMDSTCGRQGTIDRIKNNSYTVSFSGGGRFHYSLANIHKSGGGAAKTETNDAAKVVHIKAVQASGNYVKKTLSYVREDRNVQLFYWNKRWYVADMNDTPLLWSEECEPERLGTSAMLWTEINKKISDYPQHIRVDAGTASGVYAHDGTKNGRGTWVNPFNGMQLIYTEYNSWAIMQGTNALVASVGDGSMQPNPACVTKWQVGTAEGWQEDNFIVVEEVSEGSSMIESGNNFYTPHELGSTDGTPTTFGTKKEYKAVINLSMDVRSADQMVTSETDPMTNDELAGWHIVHSTTGACPRGPSMRYALSEIAVTQGPMINWEQWHDDEGAQTSVMVSAKEMLARIAQFLDRLRTLGTDARDILNLDRRGQDRYGPLSERTVEGSVVDVSRLSNADKRAFGLALFTAEGLKPHHVLDCTPLTPPEDIHNFIVRFRGIKKGRLLVNNLQVLSPDAQAEVRQAAREDNEHKELIAVITEGAGVDESVEQLDTRCCDMQWKKWAHARAVKLRKFETVTYYHQAEGEGKSFAIEKNHVEPHRASNSNAPVVRLDLNYASTAQSVSEYLLAPLRADAGLLIVNIAHDTPLNIANSILDSLVFFGKLASPSGLAVIVPINGWHLVVELQSPTSSFAASGGVAPEINCTQFNILAIDGVAQKGTLLPFRIGEIANADEALGFLEKHTEGLKDVPREEQLRMICRGTPPPDIQATGITWSSDTTVPAEESKRRNELDSMHISARAMARVARLIALRFTKFASTFAYTDNEGAGVKEVRALVAECLRYAAHQYLFPDVPNIFHLRVSDDPVPTMMVLAGTVPPPIEKARSAVRGALETFMRGLYGGNAHAGAGGPSVDLVDLEDRPLYSLVEVLATEMHVSEKETSSLLTEKGYVLIPDFLQKMVQLSEHIELHDTSILQGPSGTGKSFCVSLLADLEQQSRRHGFSGIDTALIECIRGHEMRECFPEGRSDQVGDISNVLWDAVNREDYQNVFDVIDSICDRTPAVATRALDTIRKALLDLVGPMLVDPKLHPEVTQKMYESDGIMMACMTLQSGTEGDEPQEAVKRLKTCITEVVHSLSRIGRAYMTQNAVGCVQAAIENEVYPSIVDDERLLKSLKRDHVRHALLAWARDVPAKCGERTHDVVKVLVKHVKALLARNRLLRPSQKLLNMIESQSNLTQQDTSIMEMVELLLDSKKATNFKSVLMSFDMTPQDLFEELSPILHNAVECPSVRFIVFIDEMNASNMMGMLKRIIIDRSWDMWGRERPQSDGKIPENVCFTCAVNPHKKDSALEGGDASVSVQDSELGFDVQALPPAARAHVIPWKQLSDDQRDLFAARRLGNNRTLFTNHVPRNHIDALAGTMLVAHKHVQNHLVASRSRSTVSQRDIHRTMKLFDFFFERNHDFVTGSGRPPTQVWHRALSAMIAAVAVSYYFRLVPEQRKLLAKEVTEYLFNAQATQSTNSDLDTPFHIPEELEFSVCVQRAVNLYCDPDHMKLPEAVFQHQGLMENLFVQLVCFHLRLGVILHGAPGTSKTLSNNIIRDNMTGRGDFMNKFAQISEVCRYQGSSQSTADEIKRKCLEALESQQRHDAVGRKNKRSLLFVDEAGLVGSGEMARKWGLKVLHYYLEAGLAAVLMTNDPLDPAISNRCVEVFLSKPCEEELAAICCGILHPKGMNALNDVAKQVIPACCVAYGKLMEGGSGATAAERRSPAELKWWFGLRDLFHLMRYLRRQQSDPSEVKITAESLMRGLERNFNGLPELFATVVDTFGDALSECGLKEYSAIGLRKLARRKLEVVSDSLTDNNRASEGSARNLNDMWVRFKLLVDTTADGSLLELLHGTQVHDFDGVQVLSLSSLSADELMPVTVVSQIAAAMETGKTVWLTNTRAIDGCLFDVFNQNYQCCTNGRNQVLHFVALAIGATLEYKRVHKNFQAIVHVTRAELSPDVLPAPFLNRLEKFTVGVEDILEHAIHQLPDKERRLAAWAREKCGRFARCLSVTDRCLFSAKPSDTLDSVVLEAIAKGRIEELPYDTRISVDESLSSFLWGTSHTGNAASLWRNRALHMLHLMRPEGMMLAQRVLQKAPAYVRSFFVSLSPWSFRSFTKHLSTVSKDNTVNWKRTVVYSPDNVDFGAVLQSEKYVKLVSLDAMAKSERGAEDLQEEVYRFVEDKNLSVFVLIISPAFLGQPIVREVRHLLESPPENTELGGVKSVVLLQTFRPSEFATSCTPLFSTGWDQEYIDAAADITGSDLLRYVDSNITGMKLPTAMPTWAVTEQALSEALAEVDAAQATRHAMPQLKDDLANDLYDLRLPFVRRLDLTKELFKRCPVVRSTIVELHCRYLPTPAQLVGMAQEVVARGGDPSHSLAAMLKVEENKIPCHLLAVALRLLLDDRNATALMAASQETGIVPKEIDKLMARALSLAIEGMTFDQVLMLKPSELPLVIGPSAPRLPGSLALAEQLSVGATANNVVTEAERLRNLHEDGPVGELVRIIHRNATLVTNFFIDCLRSRIRHPDAEVEASALGWILQLTRARHRQCLGSAPETVWSIRALCAVEASIIDSYVLTVLPLAQTDALKHVAMLDATTAGAVVAPHAPPQVSPEALCPPLLIEALRGMAKTGLGLNRWTTVVASIHHRTSSQNNYPEMPSLVITAKALVAHPVGEVPASGTITAWMAFINASIQQKSRIALEELCKALEATPKELDAVWRVAQTLSNYYSTSKDAHIAECIVRLMYVGDVNRAMCCRIMHSLVPQDSNGELAELFFRSARKYDAANDQPDDVVARVVKEGLVYTPSGDAQNVNLTIFKSKVYTSIYDAIVDHSSSTLLRELADKCEARYARAHSTIAAQLFDCVARVAEERIFLKLLASCFGPGNSVGSQLATGSIATVATRLMKQPGWKAPEKGEDAVGLDTRYSDNVYAFLTELRRIKGTKGMLEFLKEQTTGANLGSSLVSICGEVMKYCCANSEPLATRPCDLPFVFTVDDPLNEPFMNIHRALLMSNEQHNVQKVIDEVGKLKGKISPVEMRLLVFFTAGREFMGKRESHSKAAELANSEHMVTLLQLTPKQQHLLLVLLDPCSVTKNLTAPCGISDEGGSLRMGNKDGWTEMMVTVMATAAALPDCMLHTLGLDIETIKDTYICGDKTRSPASPGGGYKFDCVTQLDEEGQLTSYARGQEIMSVGACYLLWMVEFGALAWQAVLWPDTHQLMWDNMFSGDLKHKVHGYEKDLSSHQLLVANMAQRSQTYFVHLGMHVGLTIDEGSRLVANFCYQLVLDWRAAVAMGVEPNSQTAEGDAAPHEVVAENPLLRKTYPSREDAVKGEQHVEAWWKVLTSGNKPKLAPPSTELCKTLIEVREWGLTREPADLPSHHEVFSMFRRLSQSTAPLLLMALNENKRLQILPNLVKNIVSLISRLHIGLSGKLPLSEANSPVKELLKECYPPNQWGVAQSQWDDLRILWNKYLKDVGPIGYQCGERGEITFEIEENAPLSLFLTLSEVDSPIPLHQNIIANALNSLTRIYNDCQEVAATHSNIAIAEVDPLLLSPTRPDMTLRALGGLSQICRSYFKCREDGDILVDWPAVEKELSFDSGMLLPRLRVTIPPVFKFYETEKSTPGTLAIEETCKDTLAKNPKKLNESLTNVQEESLRRGCHHLSKTQVVECLAALHRLFESTDAIPVAPLWRELQRRQRNDQTELSISAETLAHVVVGHTQSVLRFFLMKVANCDWETSDLPVELTASLPIQIDADIDSEVTALSKTRPVTEVQEYLEDLATTLRNAEGHRLRRLPEPWNKGLVDVLSQDLLMDHEDAFDKIFINVKCSQSVALRKWLERYARKLRALQADSTEHLWIEDGADVPEMSIRVERKQGDKLVVSCNEELIVEHTEGVLATAGLRPGMKILCISDYLVNCADDVKEVLSRVETTFDVVVSHEEDTTIGEDEGLDFQVMEEEIMLEEDVIVGSRRRGAVPVKSSTARGWTNLRGHMKVLDSKQAAEAAKGHIMAVQEEPKPGMERILSDVSGSFDMEMDEDFPRQSSAPAQWLDPEVPGLPHMVRSDPMVAGTPPVSSAKRRKHANADLGKRVADLHEQNRYLGEKLKKTEERVEQLSARLDEKK
eukprot:TRINITY_DN1412_c3_g1_i1.p1 TRINITY_DN1412_c3_g1~~TRINITY_DN1412_c3_g1_i1.p1  ORF type:complete len:6410 (+),score=1681.84 TRINITY_DN1412_c3_g1_i1:202-19431(+)